MACDDIKMSACRLYTLLHKAAIRSTGKRIQPGKPICVAMTTIIDEVSSYVRPTWIFLLVNQRHTTRCVCGRMRASRRTRRRADGHFTIYCMTSALTVHRRSLRVSPLRTMIYIAYDIKPTLIGKSRLTRKAMCSLS